MYVYLKKLNEKLLFANGCQVSKFEKCFLKMILHYKNPRF